MFCEYVCYEGSEAEWRNVEIEPKNFKTGWKPAYYQNNPNMKDYVVEHVSFSYNVKHPDWE